MSYEKQNWKNGDVITETKLNHMEDGIATGGGVLVLTGTVQDSYVVLNHTFKEIDEAPLAILKMVVDEESSTLYIVGLTERDNYTIHLCQLLDPSSELQFFSDNEDDYPTMALGGE